jgi:outer membrane protein assembly factor BamE (lipoprotein component of BamABCDE complex)
MGNRKEKAMRPGLAISVLAVVSLAACSTVTVGQRFDLKTFASKVERGVTTQGQVRGWLGAPASIGVVVDTGGDRYEEWTYYFGSGRLPNMVDAQFKMLQIKFDRGGIVRGYNWTAGTD